MTDYELQTIKDSLELGDDAKSHIIRRLLAHIDSSPPLKMNNTAEIIQQAKELNIEPLLQLMEAQSELNEQQRSYIEELKERLDTDRLVKSEKRLMRVTVVLSSIILFNILLDIL